MNRATKTNTGVHKVSKVPQNFPLCENPNAEKTKTESHTYTHLICTQWNFNLVKNQAIYTLFSCKLHTVYKITCYVYGPEIKLQTFFSSQRPAMPYPLTRARGVNPYLLHAASLAKITDPAPSQMP